MGCVIGIDLGTTYSAVATVRDDGLPEILRNADGEVELTGQVIGLWQFNNPAGLNKISGTFYTETEASGAVINESTTNNIERSTMAQNFLESSNVQVADEMVNLIVAQRAYELNSKAITTSDTMLEQANNLKR